MFNLSLNYYFKCVIISLLCSIFIFSCSPCSECQTNNNVIIEPRDSGIKIKGIINTIKILEIDSCEYLYGDWGYAGVLTHKGNCKYCTNRNLKK